MPRVRTINITTTSIKKNMLQSHYFAVLYSQVCPILQVLEAKNSVLYRIIEKQKKKTMKNPHE